LQIDAAIARFIAGRYGCNGDRTAAAVFDGGMIVLKRAKQSGADSAKA